MPTIDLFSPWSHASRHPFMAAGIIIALIALVALQAWLTKRFARRQWALSLLLGIGYLAFATPGMYILFQKHPSEVVAAGTRAAAYIEFCRSISRTQRDFKEPDAARVLKAIEKVEGFPAPACHPEQ
ncbi:hypothetical protein [Pseudomonas sp. EMN2]|uniref:hypothetical protein n=1 Tax=Pseudomonas sp. EMN2 TaxID=2615212 RepID=UPI00129C106C|nr:hypothetical protein [Pseudomonas sp. EMN2]